MNRRAPVTSDPFTFSFAKLKSLLIDEEVITLGSLEESDIRQELQIHITDEAVLSKPLKYQMAWIVNDLGLVRDLSKRGLGGGPPSSRSESINESRRRSSQSQGRGATGISSGSSQRPGTRSTNPSRGASTSRSATPDRSKGIQNLKVDTQKVDRGGVGGMMKSSRDSFSTSRRQVVRSPMTKDASSDISSQSSNSLLSLESPRSVATKGKTSQGGAPSFRSGSVGRSTSSKPLPRRSNLATIEQRSKNKSSANSDISKKPTPTTPNSRRSSSKRRSSSQSRSSSRSRPSSPQKNSKNAPRRSKTSDMNGKNKAANVPSTMAWQRIIKFLCSNAEAAKAVEGLFESMDGELHKNLSSSELADGLLRLGIRLSEKEVVAFHHDVDTDQDGLVSLSEFAAFLKVNSARLIEEDKSAWGAVFSSILPGAGGEFGGAAEEAISDPIRRIEVLFNAADLDGSGDLQINELASAMNSLGVHMTDVQLALFSESIDLNGDGKISLDEFLKVFDQRHSSATDVAWKVFLKFLGDKFTDINAASQQIFTAADVNSDGMLDISELAGALKSVGISLNPLQLRLIRNQMDINGDGMITLEEFKSAIDEKIESLRKALERKGSSLEPSIASTHTAGMGRRSSSGGGGEGERLLNHIKADTCQAVAWRRIIVFLRDNPTGAHTVENFFKNEETGLLDQTLTCDQLSSGLITLGVRLDDEQIKAFHKDMDANEDGFISLSEFISCVEKHSIKFASQELNGWTSLLESLIPGAGGEFGGAAEEAISDPIRRIEVLFNAADLDGSGDLQINELASAMNSLGVHMTDVQLALFSESIDLNGDGNISLDEFVKVFDQRHSAASDIAWTAFVSFIEEKFDNVRRAVLEIFTAADVNSDGMLDISELAGALKSVGISLTPLQLRLIRDDIDANGDGVLSLEEFKHAIDDKSTKLKINRASNFKIKPTPEQLLVATWHKLLIYIREVKDGATKLESLFVLKNGTHEKLLTPSELTGGLLSIGIDLDESEVLVLLNELSERSDQDNKFRFSLAEFTEMVRVKSLTEINEERDGWVLLLSSLIPGGGGNFKKVDKKTKTSEEEKAENSQSLEKEPPKENEYGELLEEEEEKDDSNKRIEAIFGTLIDDDDESDSDDDDELNNDDTAKVSANLSHSGYVDIYELFDAMKQFDIILPDSQIALLCEKMNINKNRSISQAQFSKIFDDHHRTAQKLAWLPIIKHFTLDTENHSKLRDLFETADVNHDGVLDIEELDKALASIGIILEPFQLRLVRNDVDYDDDGVISYAELERAIARKTKRRKLSEEGSPNSDHLIVDDKEAILAVAWRRVISYLRQSPKQARNVEKMFKCRERGSEKSLTCDQLTQQLISIGIHLENRVALAFHDDIDANKDGVVTLAEFASAVEKYSSWLAEQEKAGWETVLHSLVPGTGGEFGGAAEEAISDPIRRIEVLFNAADLDGSGDLQINELAVAMKSLGVTMNDTQLALFYETLDTNGDGSVSLDEFLKVFDDETTVVKDGAWTAFLELLAQRFPSTQRAVEDMFAAIDVNRDGLLDIEELGRGLSEIGILLDPLQLKLVRDDMDVNGDGFVSLEEMISFIDEKMKEEHEEDDEEDDSEHDSDSDHDEYDGSSTGGVATKAGHASNGDASKAALGHLIDASKWTDQEKRLKMIAWRRVIAFLRESPKTAASVEKLFSNKKNGEISKGDLISGLVALGIQLDNEIADAIRGDIGHRNRFGLVTLDEFSLVVEDYSMKVAVEERDGWHSVLESLVPGAGGEFDYNSDEVLYDPVKRVQVLFNAADLDGSGDLQINELAVAMKSLGVTMNDTQLALFYETLDTNGDGSISFDEFMKVFDTRCSLANDMAWAAIISFIEQHYDDMFETISNMFYESDKDKDGLLNIDEFGEALASIGINLNPIQLKLVRDDMDVNGDGFISLEELMSAIDENVNKSKVVTTTKNDSGDENNKDEEDEENTKTKIGIESDSENNESDSSANNNNDSGDGDNDNQQLEFNKKVTFEFSSKDQTSSSRTKTDFEKTIIRCRQTKEIENSEAILLVAWRKIIDFLKQSTANARAAEALFQSITKLDEKNMNLTLSELVHGLKLLGVVFNEKEILAVNKDLKTKTDNFISLIEFANFVEEYSLKIIFQEKEAWASVLASLVPGGGGDFIGGTALEKDLNDPRKRVELLFNAADLDQSGDLQIKELYFAMKSLGIVLDDVQLGLFYETLDTNKDGSISLNEFMKVFDERHSAASDLAWTAFIHFIEENGAGDMDSSIVEIFTAADVNMDGFLDIEEIRQTLVSFGITLSDLQLKLIRDDMDINGDGLVSFEEFRETIAEKSQVVNQVLHSRR